MSRVPTMSHDEKNVKSGMFLLSGRTTVRHWTSVSRYPTLEEIEAQQARVPYCDSFNAKPTGDLIQYTIETTGADKLCTDSMTMTTMTRNIFGMEITENKPENEFMEMEHVPTGVSGLVSVQASVCKTEFPLAMRRLLDEGSCSSGANTAPNLDLQYAREGYLRPVIVTRNNNVALRIILEDVSMERITTALSNIGSKDIADAILGATYQLDTGVCSRVWRWSTNTYKYTLQIDASEETILKKWSSYMRCLVRTCKDLYCRQIGGTTGQAVLPGKPVPAHRDDPASGR